MFSGDAGTGGRLGWAMHFFRQDRNILWFLFVLALALRLLGLSHDLHHGVVYHPDTPKQMRAVQQFLHDDYLVFQGHSDYDGYPYFNSHVVEYILRGALAVETVWLKWTGAWTGPVEPPEYLKIFWLTRALNAVWSALSVPLMFVIGLRFGRRVAWMASVFLLLSPLDISAAHFASNDTTVAFFCLLSLWFGFRISERGRWRDLAGGAFCIAAAFSTKYHGAIAVLPVFFGHVLYCQKAGGVLTRDAIGRWLTLALVGLLGIVLTSPALLVNLEASVDSILHFFQYTANFNMSDDFKALPLHHRFWIGLRENIPVVADAVSWPVLGLFIVAVAMLKHDPRLGLIVLVPVLHIVVGLSGKPYLHQAHHTPITAYLFLSAAVVALTDVFQWSRTWWYRGSMFLLGGWTILQLSVFSAQEVMSFYVTDTRRVAETWMADSIPEKVQWWTSRYTVQPPETDSPKWPVYVAVQSGDQPRRLPGMIEWARFAHAQNRFSKFINLPIYFHTIDNEHLRLPVSAPYLLPYPSDRQDSVISLDAPWFGRSARVRDVRMDRPVDVWAVSTQRVDHIWLIVRTGDRPVHMLLSVGGHRKTVHLPAGRHEVVSIENPRRFLVPCDVAFYYRWKAEVAWGTARVTLVTDPSDLARWAFAVRDQHVLTNALARLHSTSLVTDVMRAVTLPADAVERRTARDRCQEVLDNPAAWRENFGMSEEWLSSVPYVSWDDTAWVPEASAIMWKTKPLLLDPGAYQLRVDVPTGTAGAITISDGAGRVIQQGQFAEESEAIMTILHPGDPITITLSGLQQPPVKTTIRPDARATVRDWMTCLEQAKPFGRSMESMTNRVAVATFDDAIDILRVEVSKDQIKPGGSIDVLLECWIKEGVTRPDRLAVWMHLVSEAGNVVAQRDKGVTSYLREIRPDPREPPMMDQIKLPDSMTPGHYELRVGLWVPSQRKRSEVSFSSFPHTDKYVVVAKIEIPDTE